MKQIKVSNYDGTPLRRDQNTVKVKYGYSRVDEIYMEEILNLDQFGVTKLELYPPINSTNTTALRIEVLIVYSNYLITIINKILF